MYIVANKLLIHIFYFALSVYEECYKPKNHFNLVIIFIIFSHCWDTACKGENKFINAYSNIGNFSMMVFGNICVHPVTSKYFLVWKYPKNWVMHARGGRAFLMLYRKKIMVEMHRLTSQTMKTMPQGLYTKE